MLYVERDKDGRIIALHNNSDKNTGEEKSVMDREVLDFLNDNVDTDQSTGFLSFSDMGIIRIVEDLIELLIRKNIILFTELPEHAQLKIMERRRVRATMSSQDPTVDDIL